MQKFNFTKVNQITQPVIEPVNLQEVKDRLRITDNTDDSRLSSLIVSARYYVESLLKRKLINQDISINFNCLIKEIALPGTPIQAVNSFSYTLNDGTVIPYSNSNYALNGDHIVILDGADSVPHSQLREYDAFEVIYTAGYGINPSDIPDPIKNGILELTVLYYEQGMSCACTDLIHQMLAPYVDGRYYII